jgi:NTP pyrophosphatase (non-canonical NTP hydrolase)
MGVQDRTPAEWLMFLGEEYGELCEAVAENQFRGGERSEIVKEAIQVATLALKIAEMNL